jgi:hypothetical protein
MTDDLNEQAPACPNCHSTNVVAIIYGLPTPAAFAMVERGERELGGCCLSADDPMWACKACHERFGNHAEFFSRLFPNIFARLQSGSRQSNTPAELPQQE